MVYEKLVFAYAYAGIREIGVQMNKSEGQVVRDWGPHRACTDKQLMSPTHCAKLGLVRRAMQGTELVHHTSGLGDIPYGPSHSPPRYESSFSADPRLRHISLDSEAQDPSILRYGGRTRHGGGDSEGV